MSSRWMLTFLFAAVACDAAVPQVDASAVAVSEDPIEMGALPEEVSEFMADGRAGLLADGASIDAMVPFQWADGRWEDLPVTFQWNEGVEVPQSNAICPGSSYYAGGVSATVSATACAPMVAAAAAKSAANDQIALDCLDIAMDECAPDFGGGVAHDDTPTVDSNVAVPAQCGPGPFYGPGWRATATASAPCCVECVSL
ncbi:MAG TPA: hypothetical protein PKA64_06180 [Myxococcota bacterium]|nr:hypothetical protein [Myxococcota bacterium]